MKIFDYKNTKYYTIALSFIIPAMILLGVFIFYGFAPFGDGSKSLLAMDMAGQYSQFYKGLKHITQQGSIFFSWSKALGTGYTGVFAYYLASPFSWLTLLCPNKYMASGILFLTVLKIGLCGSSFSCFLISKNIKKHVAILFATFYALMSYNIVYLMCLMWIDAVIFLPLLLLLIDRLVKKEKWLLLSVTYFLLFVSSYYMAYMCGIFTAVYFIYRLFFDAEKGFILRASIFGKYCLAVIVALGLSAWLTIPTAASLFEGKIGDDTSMIMNVWQQSKESLFTYDSSLILAKLYNGVYDSITNSGMLFLYCGAVVMILFVGFFLVKSIKPMKKVLLLAITIFFMLSLSLTFLNYAWHVFQRPNWFPYRFAFLFLFVVIYAASIAFDRIEQLPWHYFAAFFVVFTMLSGAATKINQNYISSEDINVTVGLVTICCCLMLFMCYKKKFIIYVVCTSVICIASIYDIGRHGYQMFEGIDEAHFYESSSQHTDYYSNMEVMINKAHEDDDTFYRVGQSAFQSFNEPIGLGYSSVSHYSSAYNATINRMLAKLGYGEFYYWVAPFGNTVITDMILSNKYYIMMNSPGEKYPDIKMLEHHNIPQNQYELLYYNDDFYLYKNQYALPVAFCAERDILDFSLSDNRVKNQNDFLNSLIDEDRQYMTEIDSSCSKENNCYRYTITATCDGVMYATFPNNGYSRKNACVNGQYYLRLYSAELECFMYLGYFHKGDTVTVDVEIQDDNYNENANSFYIIDMSKFEAAHHDLAKEQMIVTDFAEGYIEGNIYSSSGKAVFTSIPFDEGWSVLVDGHKVDVVSAAGFVGFNIDKGYHEITMKYYAKGQKLGLAITITTLLLLYSCYQCRKVRNNERYV